MLSKMRILYHQIKFIIKGVMKKNFYKIKHLLLNKIFNSIMYTFILYACSIFFLINDAYTQDADPLLDFKDVSTSMYVASGVGGNIGGRSSAVGGPGSSKLVNSSNGIIQDETLNDSEIAEGKSLKVTPGTKQSDFHTYIPKKQFTEFLKSKEWEDIYDKSIKENAASMIGATTWNLANSSVGEARFHALMQSQEAVSNHYLAELSFIKQVEQNPYMRQGITDAYFSCVRRQMKEGKKEGDKNITWFEAQEICMGDEGVDSNKFGISPELYDYSFVHDQDEKNKEICLSDYLFQQEKDKGLSDDGVAKLKESYQKLFGDIEFKMDDNNNVPGMREIKYTFYFPGTKESGKCNIPDKTKSPSDLYLDVLLHRYNLFTEATKKWCNDFRQNGKENGLQEYLNSKEFKQFVEYYKVSGFNMTVQLVDNVYKLAKQTVKNENGKIECDKVFPNIKREDLLKFGKDDGNDEKDVSRQYKTIIYTIASKVTDITLIKLYSTAYNYIGNLTTGVLGINSEIYNVANKQINQILNAAVGVDIDGTTALIGQNIAYLANVYDETNEQLNANRDGMNNLRVDGQDSDGKNEELVR